MQLKRQQMITPEAPDILNKNCYVDDMLKSVASVPEAITLVKNIRGCAGLAVLG